MPPFPHHALQPSLKQLWLCSFFSCCSDKTEAEAGLGRIVVLLFCRGVWAHAHVDCWIKSPHCPPVFCPASFQPVFPVAAEEVLLKWEFDCFLIKILQGFTFPLRSRPNATEWQPRNLSVEPQPVFPGLQLLFLTKYLQLSCLSYTDGKDLQAFLFSLLRNTFFHDLS